MKKLVISLITCMLAISACNKDTLSGTAGETRTVYQVLSTRPDSAKFSIFRTILKNAHLNDSLKGPGPFTLFAVADTFLKQAGITADSVKRFRFAQVSLVAKYFVSAGNYPTSYFPDGWERQVSQMGYSLDVNHKNRYAFLTHRLSNNTYYINGIPLTERDIPASNGILHIIGGNIEHSSLDLAATISTDPRFAYNATFVDQNSFVSAKDTTQKTVFFLTRGAMAGAYPYTVYVNDAPVNLVGIPTLQTIPGQALFDPDFYDLNQSFMATSFHGLGQLLSPVNVRFLLNPGPAILGPGNNGVPGNIARTPTVVATNGVIHFIDRGLWP